jgi:predicted nucleic acid-binding protein
MPLRTLIDTNILASMDFEDNIQIACAIANRLDAIVTRDKKFQRSSIPVLTPAELLKRLSRRGRRR